MLGSLPEGRENRVPIRDNAGPQIMREDRMHVRMKSYPWNQRPFSEMAYAVPSAILKLLDECRRGIHPVRMNDVNDVPALREVVGIAIYYSEAAAGHRRVTWQYESDAH